MALKARFITLTAGLLLLTSSQYGIANDSSEIEDPWEGVNRKIFVFNDTLDTYFLKPIAKGYRAVTPDPVETGVSNFFSNLLEINNVVNDLLQAKWAQAGNDTGRLLVNSTVGIGGLFDVAQHFGMPRSEGEDFGQTFSVWGAGQGPYIVVPFFGSTTLRDGVGMPFNAYVHPLTLVDHVPTRNSIYAGDLVDTRASLLDAEDLLSGDKYTFIRDAYLQRRDYLINDGTVEDSFGDDGDF
ncbi:MlaA family lipoprotein [Pseudomaricurvus sp.]|uniref:MlaA family lipoprotein n=1 Tax=Pseudomaricurvus sp. TaxID=2004510 RepID=UPI003F6AB5B8